MTVRGLPWWFLIGLVVEVVAAAIAVAIVVMVFFAFGEIRYQNLVAGLAVLVGIPALATAVTALFGGLLVRRNRPVMGGFVAFWPIVFAPLYFLGLLQ